jgi:hypothetical protein
MMNNETMVTCRTTGQTYDPMVELDRIMRENADVLVRLKVR